MLTTACHPVQSGVQALLKAIAKQVLGMADSDDDDFHFVGTPLEEEVESRAGQRPRPGTVAKDAAATRSLPIHKQVTFLIQPLPNNPSSYKSFILTNLPLKSATE